MKTLFDGDTFEHNGHQFRVRFEYDVDGGYPWEDCDGHGPVRQSNLSHYADRSDKHPGERPLNRADRNEYQFYYDWQAAVKLARRDGWNAEPYDAPGRIERAVQANFDYLAGYVSDDWQYLVVTVEMLDSDGDVIADTNLGRVESYKDYHVECAYELADELIVQAKCEERQERINNRFPDAMVCGL